MTQSRMLLVICGAIIPQISLKSQGSYSLSLLVFYLALKALWEYREDHMRV